MAVHLRIDCGHRIAEEAPGELAAELAAFFATAHGDGQLA